jgi:hypothetical protein
MVMLRRALLLVALGGPWAATACAPAEAVTADPEAMQLDPPVVVVEDEPEPAPPPTQTAVSLPVDPKAEVITFTGEDADPGMADEVSGAPKRDPLPSMMSDVLHGPNK